jgi:hypothetical protein
MLREPDESSQVMMASARIAALDRARTFVTLLVLLHHSVLNYTWFGHGDPKRWLGFDLVVLFNDSFFMAFMFFISGLFVRDSLVRKGSAQFLRDRARSSLPDAGRSGSALRSCSTRRSLLPFTPITIGWRISIRRR